MLYLWLAVITALGSAVPAGGSHWLYRFGEKTGDTIDVAERNQYHLFPGIPDFQSAVVLAGDSFDYQVEIASGTRDTTEVWTARLMPTEVERIRFIIENPEHIEQELATNEDAGSVLDRFWTDIESRLVVKEATKTGIRPGTAEGRIFGTAAGVTAGACLGGMAGAATSVRLVSSEEAFRSPTCVGCLTGRAQCGLTDCGVRVTYEKYTIFTYSMDAGRFALVSGSVMGVCAAGGLLTGLMLDRRPLTEPLPHERKTWRTVLSVLGGVGGVALGIVTSGLLTSSLYGRVGRDGDWGYDEFKLDNEPWVAKVPAIISGVGVAVESAYLGYVLGRTLDRHASRPRAERPGRRNRRIRSPEPPSQP